jgi:legumain
MVESGISPDHIILMMNDDVANSRMNPFRGQLFNKDNFSVDVYAGCNVDYRGGVVTAELFVKVITGDASAGGKVLKSGPNDRVFINFVDHGGVGIVGFPHGAPLHVTQLSAALETMQQKKLFSELVFYMEACESGSMFPNISSDSKIFAVTAANAKESSWGYYCPPQDVINGTAMHTCLGDLFSISWMEDFDHARSSSETLKRQVANVTKRVTKSHVETFGDTSFENEVIGNFELGAAGASPEQSDGGFIDSREIHLQYYKNRYDSASTAAEKAAAWKDLQQAISDRTEDLAVIANIVKNACKGAGGDCESSLMKSKQDLANFACHHSLVNTFFQSCLKRGENAPGGWNSFNMQFSQVLVNLCQMPANISKSTEALSAIVSQECASVAAVTSEVIV